MDGPAPEQPGWYADAQGAWWWWDGRSWTDGAVAAAAGVGRARGRDGERTLALATWLVYLLAGGFIASLIFYVVCRDRPFVRHHAAESLNLTLALLVIQVPAAVLVAPYYVEVLDAAFDGRTPGTAGSGFAIGLVLLLVGGAANWAAGIAGAVQAHRGRWWRVPQPFHPVRGAVRPGEEPYAPT